MFVLHRQAALRGRLVRWQWSEAGLWAREAIAGCAARQANGGDPPQARGAWSIHLAGLFGRPARAVQGLYIEEVAPGNRAGLVKGCTEKVAGERQF